MSHNYKLTADAHKVFDWCTANRMATKTKDILITTWQKRAYLTEMQKH